MARGLIIVLVVLLASMSCLKTRGLDQRGMVLLNDSSYRPSVVGTTGDGITQPDGILWRDGKLFMADEGGHALRVWTAKHDVRTLCDRTLGIRSPEDLVVDVEGNVFFTDDEAGGLWEVSHEGHAFLLAGKDKGLVSTEGIVLTPSGEILVGDGVRHTVFSVDRAGNVSKFLDATYGITKPESMVYDDRGDLYIADNTDDVLYLLTPRKRLQRLIENREGFSPEGIWYANHVLYITDSKHGKLSRFTPYEGLTNIAVFAGSLSYLCGITTDEQGDIYLTIQSDLKRDLGYVLELERTHPAEQEVITGRM